MSFVERSNIECPFLGASFYSFIRGSPVQVFQEVLRLYPPGGGTGRESPSDDFKLSGYTIPKGTRILLSFYTNQRNPEHWEDPEMFDPSRFDPDRGKYVTCHINLLITQFC